MSKRFRYKFSIQMPNIISTFYQQVIGSFLNDLIYHSIKRNQISRNKPNTMNKISTEKTTKYYWKKLKKVNSKNKVSFKTNL